MGIRFGARRYPAIPILLATSDVMPAFKLIPLSIIAIYHAGFRVWHSVMTYLGLHLWRKRHTGTWGAISTPTHEYISKKAPPFPDVNGAEISEAFQFSDDG